MWRTQAGFQARKKTNTFPDEVMNDCITGTGTSFLQATPADDDARLAAAAPPLHTACGYDHADITQLLVDAGADVNLKDDAGQTPLDVARLNDAVECAKIVAPLTAT